MKILFIQLPFIDHAYGYVNGNIDYAPAVISSYIKKNFKEVTCETLPAVISNFCSDDIITKYAVSIAPDIICFTSYLWNIERNIQISGNLRKEMESVLIIFGGPEISEGSVALSENHSEIDIFVNGEGEWFFNKFFSGDDINYIDINGNSVAVQSINELINKEDIIEPLTANNLNAFIDGSVFMEMTRGCPYRCSYCFYSKNHNRLRELSFSLLTDVLKKRKDIKEIYILCPTFDRSKDFIQNLKILKSLKHNVSLHTEIRTDKITPEIAGLMYEAGFRSLEVGLQTINKKALDNVQRESNPERELDGIECLADAGIKLTIGIIPGLPGDDISSFKKTVDILCDRGFESFIELYPLMILPGTTIREKSDKDRIKYQDKPPYYFLEGWNFRFDQIKKLESYIENKTGMSTEIFYLPDFNESDDILFNRGLFLKDNSSFITHEIISEKIHTVVADLHIRITDIDKIYEQIKELIKGYDRNRLYNIILYTDEILENDFFVRTVSEFESDSFYRRLNVFNSFAERSIFHFFQVIENIEKYFEAAGIYNFITPVLLVKQNSVSEIIKLNFNDIPLLIEDGIYPQLMEFLTENYSENPEYVAFKNSSEMQNFYKDIDVDIVKFPYNLGLCEL